MYLFINRRWFYWTTIHLSCYLHTTILSVTMKLGAQATPRKLLRMNKNVFLFLSLLKFLFLCFCLVSFVLTFRPSYFFPFIFLPLQSFLRLKSLCFVAFLSFFLCLHMFSILFSVSFLFTLFIYFILSCHGCFFHSIFMSFFLIC
jgi:hypothetical protein